MVLVALVFKKGGGGRDGILFKEDTNKRQDIFIY